MVRQQLESIQHFSYYISFAINFKSKLIHLSFMHRSIEKQHPILTRQASIEKIQQLGQKHYKQAMRHVQKFNKYQTQRREKHQKSLQELDSECTFTPKINQTSYTMKYFKNHQDYRWKVKPKNEKQNISNYTSTGATTYRRLFNWGEKTNVKNTQKFIDKKYQIGMDQLSKSVDEIKIQKDPYHFLRSHSKEHMIRGTKEFYRRQAKAKAQRQVQKGAYFRDDSTTYSLISS